jgi:hypothetical protein
MKHLKELDFVYEVKGRKAILFEREGNISWLRKHLPRIKKFREENKNTVYKDKSYINLRHTAQKRWKEKGIGNPKASFPGRPLLV